MPPDQTLFEQAVSHERLYQAREKVRRNKGCAGGDGVTIEKFERQAGRHLETLRQRLVSGSYMPAPLRKVDIPKASGEIRTLSVPSISDRIAQTAFAAVLTPHLEPEFEDCSYGYRQGKSVQMAVAQIERLRDAGFDHVIEADIEDYFNAVPHAQLYDVMQRHIPDSRMIHVILLWLRGFNDRGFGLPQGSPISPLLANLYLDALDEEFSRHHVRIVRFADDFLILCKSQKSAEKTLKELTAFLKEYGLTLNPEKTEINHFNDGFKFLGHLFTRSLVLQSKQDDILAQTPDLQAPIPYIDYDETEEETAEAEEDRTPPDGEFLQHRALCITRGGLYLDASYQSFILHDRETEQRLLHIPADAPLRIEITHKSEISNAALHLAIEHDIPVDFIGPHNQVTGCLYPHDDCDAYDNRLHLQQAEHTLDPQKRFELAKIITRGKIYNQRVLLKRLNRTRKNDKIEKICDKLKADLKKTADLTYSRAASINTLLGFEGKASRDYYKGLSYCITDPSRRFDGRGDKRNPSHAGAVMINIFSSFLARDMRAVLSRSSLHRGFACLHSPANVPDALVYDLIEEFRPLLVESLMIYLMNNQILSPGDFITTETGRIAPVAGVYRALVLHYEKRANKQIEAPDGSLVTWRGLMKKQADSLKKHFTGEERYIPYKADY